MKEKKNKVFPTMASELVKKLQKAINEWGDHPVAVQTEEGFVTHVFVNPQEYYYDGGYLLPIDDTRKGDVEYAHGHFITSRIQNKKGMTIPHPDLDKEHLVAFKLMANFPCDLSDTVNGRPELVSLMETEEEGDDFSWAKNERTRNNLINDLHYMTPENQEKVKKFIGTFPVPTFIPSDSEFQEIQQAIDSTEGWDVKNIIHTLLKKFNQGNLSVIRSFLKWAGDNVKADDDDLPKQWRWFLEDYKRWIREESK